MAGASRRDANTNASSRGDKQLHRPEDQDHPPGRPPKERGIGVRSSNFSIYPCKPDNFSIYPSKPDNLSTYTSKADNFSIYPSKPDIFSIYPCEPETCK